MKKEDKVSRLKERKRAREKRQRWRRREQKRLARAMAGNIELPTTGGVSANPPEVEEKMGELAPMVMPTAKQWAWRREKMGLWAWIRQFCVRVGRRGG